VVNDFLKKKKHAKYLTGIGISSNAVFIHILINTPSKVKMFPGSEGVNLNGGCDCGSGEVKNRFQSNPIQ
jgi:hypothetical protein